MTDLTATIATRDATFFRPINLGRPRESHPGNLALILPGRADVRSGIFNGNIAGSRVRPKTTGTDCPVNESRFTGGGVNPPGSPVNDDGISDGDLADGVINAKKRRTATIRQAPCGFKVEDRQGG